MHVATMKTVQMICVISILGLIVLSACSSDQPIQPTGPVSNVTSEAGVLTSDPICQSVRSTFFGGGETNRITRIDAIAIGNDNHIYVAGTTDSSRLPATRNNFQPSFNLEGDSNAFVAEFTEDLDTLIAATYAGRAAMDTPITLSVGKEGQIYVAGKVDWGRAFIAELTPDLKKEQNFIADRAGPIRAMTIDPNGNVYIAGGGSVFGSPNAYLYAVEFTSDLHLLRRYAFFGGNEETWTIAIAVGPSGKVYVAGDTTSDDFPKTLGGAQPGFSGDSDAFVIELSSDLGQIIQTTYFGGSGSTAATTLAIGQRGQVYMAGYTSASDLPGTDGAAQPRLASNDDAYVTELSSDLKSITRTTYIGGTRDDTAWAMAVSKDNQVYVAGMTHSSDFPGVAMGVQPDITRGFIIHPAHGFISKISGDLRLIIQSSYYIGTDYNGRSLEEIHGIALGTNGYLYLTGNTQSTSLPCGALGALKTLGDKVNGGFIARLPATLRANTNN